MAMVINAGEYLEGALQGAMTVGDVRAAVYPMAWEAFPVWARFAKPADWTAVDAWKRKWLSRDGAEDEDGLHGRAHYLGEPVLEGGGHLRELDLGSAPAEALGEYLEALVAGGAVEIEVGRSDGSDLEEGLRKEIQRPDLTPAMLAQLVATAIRRLGEVEGVEVASELELRITARGRGGYRAMVGNLYALMQRTPPEGRVKELWRFVRGQREILQDRDVPDLSQLRPVIKDDRFMEQVKGMGKMKPLVARRLAGDLWVCCVWDSPNGMKFATEEQPGQYGLSLEQMHERAVKNYLKQRAPVEWVKSGELLVARTGDCYDASLLLNDAVWEEAAGKVKGEVLVCVPARDIVLVGGKSIKTVTAMRIAAIKVSAGRDHLISETILIRVGKGWEVVWTEKKEEGGGAGAPGASEAPVPEGKEGGGRRPWWKFWG